MKRGSPEPISALNRIKICETGEPLVDIREFCPHVEVLEKVCPYLRRTVAEMLNHAQSALPAAYKFRVGTALRTLSMQRRGWDAYFQKTKDAHPDWPLSALRRATNRYHAPYDQLAPPGHCTGGAVDVILLGPDGEPADVISPTIDWEAAYTWSDRISEHARYNRMLMVEAMLGAGFSNCREEYWHYSFGDSAWAVRVGEKNCPYGWVYPPVAVEYQFEGGRAAGVSRQEDETWLCRPMVSENGVPTLHVGLFWSLGSQIELLVVEPLPEELLISTDRDTWEPVEAIDYGDGLRIALTPEADRVYIASEAFPPPAAATSADDKK